MKIVKNDDKSIAELGLVPEYKKMLKDTVQIMNNKCEEILESDRSLPVFEMSIMRKFPKCLVRSAMQECLCEDDCVKNIFEGIKWSERCYLYSLKNLYNANSYINCDALAYKPRNDRLYEHHFGNNQEKAKDNFFRYLNEFCTDPTFFNKFKCAAYELRDEFGNNKQAIYGLKFNPRFKPCDNPEALNQLSEISSILLSSPLDRPENKIFEDQYFKSSENGEPLMGRSLKQFNENFQSQEKHLFSTYYQESGKLNSNIFIVLTWGGFSWAIYKNKKLSFTKKMVLIIISAILGLLLISTIN